MSEDLMPQWQDMLSEEPGTRWRAVDRLTQAGEDGLPTLEHVLCSEPGGRWAASIVAKLLGATARELAGVLVEIVICEGYLDYDADQMMAAEALAAIGTVPPEDVVRIIDFLRERHDRDDLDLEEISDWALELSEFEECVVCRIREALAVALGGQQQLAAEELSSRIEAILSDDRDESAETLGYYLDAFAKLRAQPSPVVFNATKGRIDAFDHLSAREDVQRIADEIRQDRTDWTWGLSSHTERYQDLEGEEALVAAWKELLSDPDEPIQWAAANALTRHSELQAAISIIGGQATDAKGRRELIKNVALAACQAERRGQRLGCYDDVLSLLRRQLQSDDRETQLLACNWLREFGVTANPTISDLRALLSHQDADLRFEAACAILTIDPTAEDVKSLILTLAPKYLQQLVPGPWAHFDFAGVESLADELIAVLEDMVIRGESPLEELDFNRNLESLATLLTAPGDKDMAVMKLAMLLFPRDDEDPNDMDALTRESWRGDVAWRIGECGASAAAAVPIMLLALNDRRQAHNVGSNIVRALPKIAPQSPDVHQTLVSEVAHPPETTYENDPPLGLAMPLASEAARALGKCGPHARPVAAKLAEFLRHRGYAPCYVYAAEAHWKTTGQLDVALPRIKQTVETAFPLRWDSEFCNDDSLPVLRTESLLEAARVLGEIGPSARELVPHLRDMLHDVDFVTNNDGDDLSTVAARALERIQEPVASDHQ